MSSSSPPADSHLDRWTSEWYGRSSNKTHQLFDKRSCRDGDIGPSKLSVELKSRCNLKSSYEVTLLAATKEWSVSQWKTIKLHLGPAQTGDGLIQTACNLPSSIRVQGLLDLRTTQTNHSSTAEGTVSSRQLAVCFRHAADMCHAWANCNAGLPS